MKIIAVVGQKGGVGKTTIASNLAGGLVEKEFRVLLVDADPQASTQEWFGAGEGEGWPQVVGCSQPIMHKRGQLRALKEFDFIVIDGPPQRDDLTQSALYCADLAILPISPSALDLRAISRTVKLCNEALDFNDGLRAVFLVSKKQSTTVIGRETRRALRGMEGIPLLKTEITQRVVLAEIPTHGALIQQYAPDSKSYKEFQMLTDEILQILANVPCTPQDQTEV